MKADGRETHMKKYTDVEKVSSQELVQLYDLMNDLLQLLFQSPLTL